MPAGIWKTLRSRVGSRVRDYLPVGGKTSYSQEGEDLLLERLLHIDAHPVGFYVDVGAHHPTRFSNTYRFYRRGWRGINIDARPGTKQLFDRQRPRDINLEHGVAAARGELEFIQFNDPALNTFSAEEAAKKDHPPFRIVARKRVPVAPLSALLDAHLPPGQAIDFMSVDVEGLDDEVLASNDWGRYRPRFLIAEMLATDFAAVPRQPLAQRMAGLGYEPVAKLYNSVFFARGTP